MHTLFENSEQPVIATKATKEDFEEVIKLVPKAIFHEEAMLIVAKKNHQDVPYENEIGKNESLNENLKVNREDNDEKSVLGNNREESKAKVAIVTGGTSDIPIAEEAAVTLETMDIPVEKFYDVGVAAIDRLLLRAEQIKEADVVIVIAGMEGALASVIGGIVKAPIIAVPTSVGYGANFEGIAALLSMLNSCAPGVSIVNIDNGFGAACSAIKILNI